MDRLSSPFGIEVFERRNAKSRRLAEFMAIYVQNFGAPHRTEANELLDFLADPPPDRLIIYFGLTLDEAPCGFATFMYYPEGRLAIIDHLVVAPGHRGYGGFFSFCDLLTRYFEEKRITFDHLVAEVMLDDRNLASHLKPNILVRLLRMVGFRVAKIAYWAPDPMIVRDEDGCKAVLLIASQPERDCLSLDEFGKIVRIVYEVHYGVWYKRVMTRTDFARYEASANRKFIDVMELAGRGRTIVLNGMKNLDAVYLAPISPPADAPTLFYISLLALPSALTVVLALKQEFRLAAYTIATSLVLILFFVLSSPLRRLLRRAFRLEE